jgi:hypothetical protein
VPPSAPGVGSIYQGLSHYPYGDPADRTRFVPNPHARCLEGHPWPPMHSPPEKPSEYRASASAEPNATISWTGTSCALPTSSSVALPGQRRVLRYWLGNSFRQTFPARSQSAPVSPAAPSPDGRETDRQIPVLPPSMSISPVRPPHGQARIGTGVQIGVCLRSPGRRLGGDGPRPLSRGPRPGVGNGLQVVPGTHPIRVNARKHPIRNHFLGESPVLQNLTVLFISAASLRTRAGGSSAIATFPPIRIARRLPVTHGDFQEMGRGREKTTHLVNDGTASPTSSSELSGRGTGLPPARGFPPPDQPRGHSGPMRHMLLADVFIG